MRPSTPVTNPCFWPSVRRVAAHKSVQINQSRFIPECPARNIIPKPLGPQGGTICPPLSAPPPYPVMLTDSNDYTT
ncbi:hypothetical protein GGP41_010489 [Bipolaris sorokiniana]|uniref:Uncharacterized protein n=1 Tax=Cochliobolus sativus TaxID=45130 RepID=A0A8H5ZII3_COCSA|nr:hypothetical protein GGP41_010489 [Bipolaris sorokiniana]